MRNSKQVKSLKGESTKNTNQQSAKVSNNINNDEQETTDRYRTGSVEYDKEEDESSKTDNL